MNTAVYYSLPEPEREPIRISLRNQVMGETCRCGSAKEPRSWFCPVCEGRLNKAGCFGELIYALAEQRSATRHRVHYEFAAYDRLVDVLVALECGRWTGKSQPKNDN